MIDFVYAQTPNITMGGQASPHTFNSLAMAAANVMWLVFTVIVIVCFIVAAILFLSAEGQPEKIKTAKSAFIWGVAGVVVGIVAYSIIWIVGTALGA